MNKKLEEDRELKGYYLKSSIIFLENVLNENKMEKGEEKKVKKCYKVLCKIFDNIGIDWDKIEC